MFAGTDPCFSGDIKELYDVKLDLDHWAAFSEDCSGSSKRLTLMKVNWNIVLETFFHIFSVVLAVCLNWCLMSQSTAKVMLGHCLPFMGLLPKLRMS